MSNRAQRRMEKFGNFSDTRWRYNDPRVTLLSLARDQNDAAWESWGDSMRDGDEIDVLWDGLYEVLDAYYFDDHNNRVDSPTYY